MTYRSLLRYAWDVARSHWTHVVPRIRAFAWECGYVAGVVAVTMPVGITIGAERAREQAEERHLEDLRRLVPVAEAALGAHRSELEALTDTIEAIPAVGFAEEDR